MRQIFELKRKNIFEKVGSGSKAHGFKTWLIAMSYTVLCAPNHTHTQGIEEIKLFCTHI